MLTTSEPKVCATCSHLLGNRSYPDNWEGWRCNAEGNIQAIKVNLVSGLPQKQYIMERCSNVREADSMCGPTGVWWEEYVKPIHTPLPELPRAKKSFGFSADEL